MSRLTLAHWQALFVFFLIAALFTASIGGVTAGEGQPQGIAPTPTAKTRKSTKTPSATKTRKTKKTRMATPTDALTETPAPSETLEATPTATETPTAAGTRTLPAPKQTRKAKKTQQARKTRHARKTRQAQKSRTPTPTRAAQGACTPKPRVRKTTASISRALGGRLLSPDCRVRVTFPPNVVRHDAVAQFVHGAPAEGHVQIQNGFQLHLLNAQGAEIAHSEFEDEVEIQVTYEPDKLGAFKEDLLDLAYFAEETQEWLPLKAVLDKENHTLTAHVEHFSTFGLTAIDDVLPYLPGLKDFQTSLFTGVSTASVPLELPAGRGGLKPHLALTYSSAAANAFDSGTQASYVGAGWSLDTGYVTRNTLNKAEPNQAYFALVLNGTASDLIPHPDSTYRTSDDQYLRITSDAGTSANPNTFTVWSKDGTKYVFGNGVPYRAKWWRVQFNGTRYEQNYLWMLKSVTDPHGNVINYTYRKESGASCLVNGVAQSYDTAMYPLKVTYNSGNTEIRFNYENRTDQAIAYPRYMCHRAPYQQTRLDNLEIYGVVAGGGTLTLLRKYDLNYYAASPVFPGVPYTSTNTTGALGLQEIKTIAPNGTTLPPYTFAYVNSRLGKVNNGIGGEVRYTYQRTSDPPNVATSEVYNMTVSHYCNNEGGAPWGCIRWGGQNRQSGNMQTTIEKDCGVSYDMQAWSTDNNDAYVAYDLYPFQPGGVYYVTARVQGWGSNSNVQVGASGNPWGATETRTSTIALEHCGALVDTPPLRVELSDTAATLQLRIHTTRKVRVKSVRVWKVLVSPGVVASKTVDDGRGNAARTLYAYFGGAVNDAAHSAIINDRGCQAPVPQWCEDLVTAPSTEFRGFETVRAGEPKEDGTCCFRVTEYRFLQDDVFRGQIQSVTVREDADGNLGTDGGNKFLVTTNEWSAVNTIARNNAFGTQSNFVSLSRQTAQTYDGNNTAAPKSVMTEFDYDNYGNLTTKREFNANNALYRTTTTSYNKKNDPANGVYLVGLPNVTQVKDANNTVVSYTDNEWDTTGTIWRGELLKVMVDDGSGVFTRAEYGYDAYGQRIWSKDAKGNTTTIGYEALYNTFPATVTTPLGTTTTAYDYRFGLPKEITDVNGGKTKIEYDEFGRKSKIWNALDEPFGSGAETQKITYTLNSTPPSRIRIQTRADVGGGATPAYTSDWTFVDGLGRVIQTQKPSEDGGVIIVTHRQYYLRGELWRTSNPVRVSAGGGTFQTPSWNELAKTRYEYDVVGRQTKLTQPGSQPITTVYDHWLTTVTNEQGIPTVYRNDAFGRTNRVTESENGVAYHTVYSYDVLDRLSGVTDSANNVTTMTYDWLGRKKTMNDPDMGAWSYRYDTDDNLIEQTDAQAQRTCFYYDALKRLKGKNYQTNASQCPGDPGTYAVTYRYDEGTNALGQTQRGFRTSMSDANGNSVTWRYDLLGRLLVESKTIPGAPANPYVTEYAYDDLNRIVTMKYPDGEIVTAAYNLQRLPEVLTGYVTSASYAASDQMTNLTLGNGIATNYTYNAQTLRLETLQTGPSNNIQNFSYGYDNVGNVLNINDVLRAQNTIYTYDHLNRLKTATLAAVYAHSWTYNSIGNILTRNDNNGNVTYQYNDAAHKHAVSQIGSAYFCYDANGNMTRRNATSTACTNGDTLAYDKENKLTSITVGANTTTYVYDGDGNRVKKTANGVTTYYVGNHYEVTNGIATKYYYFGKQRVAMKVGTTVTYLHGDHLGSASVTTNSSGACTSTQWFYAYGNVRTPAPTTPCSGTLPTDFTFTGQRRDASANLMYYNARYYDTTLGRFVSADTLVPSAGNPQDLNRYTYTRNNPVRYTDPSGHCATCVIGGAIGAMVGAVAYTVDVAASGRGAAGWDYNGYWAAVGTGAIGGAMIGSGNPFAIGAGIGMIGNGGYYIHDKTQQGEAVNLETWAVDSAIGGIAGAGSVGAGPLGAGAINALAGVNTLIFNNAMEDKPITVEGAGITAITSFFGGAIGARLGSKTGDVTIKSGMKVVENARFGIYKSGTLILPKKFAAPIGQQGFAAIARDLGLWFGTGYAGDYTKSQFPGLLEWLIEHGYLIPTSESAEANDSVSTNSNCSLEQSDCR